MAERAGFDALWIPDHFHPWLDEQGQSSFVWSVIGAISRPRRGAHPQPIPPGHPGLHRAAARRGVRGRGRWPLGGGLRVLRHPGPAGVRENLTDGNTVRLQRALPKLSTVRCGSTGFLWGCHPGLAGMVNAATHTPGLSRLAKRAGGIDPKRDIPRFARRRSPSWVSSRRRRSAAADRRVILWPDTFSNNFHPEVAQAAVAVETRAPRGGAHQAHVLRTHLDFHWPARRGVQDAEAAPCARCGPRCGRACRWWCSSRAVPRCSARTRPSSSVPTTRGCWPRGPRPSPARFTDTTRTLADESLRQASAGQAG